MSDAEVGGVAPVIPIESALPHFSGELICLGCHHRAVHVWPCQTPLARLACDCGAVGLLIATGQPRLEPEGVDDAAS